MKKIEKIKKNWNEVPGNFFKKIQKIKLFYLFIENRKL